MPKTSTDQRAWIAEAVRIEVRYGYWITLLGLAGAAAAGLMSVARRGPPVFTPIDE